MYRVIQNGNMIQDGFTSSDDAYTWIAVNKVKLSSCNVEPYGEKR